MRQSWSFVLLGLLSFTASGCFGLPFGLLQQDEEPEQYMTHPPGHDHTDDGGHEMPDMDHGMSMYFTATVHATILFEKWHTMNWWELMLSCLAIAVLACLYEGFKLLREFVAKKTIRKTVATITPADKSAMGSSSMMIEEDIPASFSITAMFDQHHLLQSLLHFVQLFLSYTLMLVFMTYNIYLCLALCIGGAVGYFIFRCDQSFKADNEHCN